MSNLYTPRNTVISPLTFTRFTSRKSIFDKTMSAKRFARLLMKKFRYYNILDSLTSRIAFIDVSYIRHNCVWMDFASNKPATNNFVYYGHEAGGG